MRANFAMICLAVCVFLPACSTGPAPVKVTGKLLYNDKPLEFDKNGGITVRLDQVDDDVKNARSFAADINRDDMSFVVKDRGNAGIPPGKYRITVNLMSLQETPQVREINERFSQQNTKLEREITGETSLILDLAKPEGK